MKSSVENYGILDNRYYLKKILGAGAFSTVYKVEDSQTGKEYAAKVFSVTNDSIKKEIEINKIISNTNNNNIIKYIHSSKGPLVIDDFRTFKSYIIFELGTKGGLNNYLEYKGAGLKEKYCKFIFFKILKGIQALHEINICHRDIKVKNILLDGDNYNIKICDFGFSSFTNGKNGPILQTGILGTEYYCAPEILMNIPYNGKKADIFSLGVVLFNLRTNTFGFQETLAKKVHLRNNRTLYEYIINKNIKAYWKKLETIINIKDLSNEFKKLYIKMVSFNPKERPSIEEILNDEWMKEIKVLNEEELQKLESEVINEFKRREMNLLKRS